mmetsp:Transcript_9427/g.26657  ORF Transcript_9427/g.26657 Transcript_9427/m.26657 type:complete len:85 (+) Transcript_9427:1266-1520(+)
MPPSGEDPTSTPTRLCSPTQQHPSTTLTRLHQQLTQGTRGLLAIPPCLDIHIPHLQPCSNSTPEDAMSPHPCPNNAHLQILVGV